MLAEQPESMHEVVLCCIEAPSLREASPTLVEILGQIDIAKAVGGDRDQDCEGLVVVACGGGGRAEGHQRTEDVRS